MRLRYVIDFFALGGWWRKFVLELMLRTCVGGWQTNNRKDGVFVRNWKNPENHPSSDCWGQSPFSAVLTWKFSENNWSNSFIYFSHSVFFRNWKNILDIYEFLISLSGKPFFYWWLLTSVRFHGFWVKLKNRFRKPLNNNYKSFCRNCHHYLVCKFSL